MDEIKFTEIIYKASLSLEMRTIRVLEFFDFVSSRESVDSKVLLRKFGFPETQYKKLLHLFRDYIAPPPGPIRLKDRKMVNIYTKTKLEKNRSIDKTSILNVLEKYKALRPTPNREFDQFFATRATTAKRALKMAKQGDLTGRCVAFLGDDDLNSIAVAMTGQTAKITVFEIDQNIISVITTIAQNEELDIEVVKLDVRKDIPKEYLSKFDTVFTDPPYTPSGISLFINRGIELLKNKMTSRIYVCYGNSDRARERELEIQKIIIEKGLLINTKLFQFNKYNGAESIGSSSSLYLLDWTPKTQTTNVNTERLYTHE